MKKNKKKTQKRHQKPKQPRKKCKSFQKKCKKKRRTFKNKMKGGTIPFAEVSPSSLFDIFNYNIQSLLSPIFDYAQIVPDNLEHNINPKTESQPHLEKTKINSIPVVGTEPQNYFDY